MIKQMSNRYLVKFSMKGEIKPSNDNISKGNRGANKSPTDNNPLEIRDMRTPS